MFNVLVLSSALLQNDDLGLFGSLISSFFSCLCGGIFFVIVVAGLWKVFSKADEPGWAAIIPIYNLYVLTKIIGRPWWWLILLFIPVVGFFVHFIMAIDLAKSFGKDTAYGIILLGILNLVGYLILGFGDAEYVGPAAAQKV